MLYTLRSVKAESREFKGDLRAFSNVDFWVESPGKKQADPVAGPPVAVSGISGDRAGIWFVSPSLKTFFFPKK